MNHIKSFTSYTNESLTEGLMVDLHQLAKEAKSAKDFIDRFFAEHGDKVKRNRDSEEWVKNLYADTVKEDYFAGISKSTAAKKKTQMTKQAKMSDDDPAAYKELPGDTKGKGLLKTSDHTKKYHELYGEGASLMFESSSTDKLASEIDGAKVYDATSDGTSVQAVYTNKTWPDGVPVLKSLARSTKKTVKLPPKFRVVDDTKYGWWYFWYQGTWYGIDKDEYSTPPFEY
jgi:hypothetical protein